MLAATDIPTVNRRVLTRGDAVPHSGLPSYHYISSQMAKGFKFCPKSVSDLLNP
jgi:hypothetical protein